MFQKRWLVGSSFALADDRRNIYQRRQKEIHPRVSTCDKRLGQGSPFLVLFWRDKKEQGIKCSALGQDIIQNTFL
jgi:hypothetical protein